MLDMFSPRQALAAAVVNLEHVYQGSILGIPTLFEESEALGAASMLAQEGSLTLYYVLKPLSAHYDLEDLENIAPTILHIHPSQSRHLVETLYTVEISLTGVPIKGELRFRLGCLSKKEQPGWQQALKNRLIFPNSKQAASLCSVETNSLRVGLLAFQALKQCYTCSELGDILFSAQADSHPELFRATAETVYDSGVWDDLISMLLKVSTVSADDIFKAVDWVGDEQQIHRMEKRFLAPEEVISEGWRIIQGRFAGYFVGFKMGLLHRQARKAGGAYDYYLQVTLTPEHRLLGKPDPSARIFFRAGSYFGWVLFCFYMHFVAISHALEALV